MRIVILVVLAGACIARGGQRDYWPTREWKHGAAEEHGVDSAALDAACAAVPQNYPRFRSLLLVRHGRIVYERYFRTASAESSHNWMQQFLTMIARHEHYADHRRVDGVMVPFKVWQPETELPGWTLTVRAVVHNVDIPDDDFRNPVPRFTLPP